MLGPIQTSVGGAGNLGTLAVQLDANSTRLVTGMRQAELAVKGGSERMLRQVKLLGAGMTAAFAAVGAASLKQYGQFQQGMTESLAIMGNVNDDLKQQMETTARDIAVHSKTGADELARSYYYLASAGLSAEQSIASLGVVEKFAVAGAFDMAKATDLLTDAQSALGLSFKDPVANMREMKRLSDVLVRANTLANASVQQFSEALTHKGATAIKLVNKEMEEGVAVLAAFADRGVKANVAGEQLNMALRDLQRAALGNADVFKEMNVAVFDESTGAMRNMADIMEDLENALGRLTTKQRRMAFEAMGFQDRSLAALMTLLGASGKIREYEAALKEAGGTTEEVYDKQLRGFNAQLAITRNIIEDVAISIGKGLAPVLLEANAALQKWLAQDEKTRESITNNVQVLGEGLMWLVKTTGTAAGGFMDLLRLESVGILQVAEITLKAIRWIRGGIDEMMDAVWEKFKTNSQRLLEFGDDVLAAGARKLLGSDKAANQFVDAMHKAASVTKEEFQTLAGAANTAANAIARATHTEGILKFATDSKSALESLDSTIQQLQLAQNELWDDIEDIPEFDPSQPVTALEEVKEATRETISALQSMASVLSAMPGLNASMGSSFQAVASAMTGAAVFMDSTEEELEDLRKEEVKSMLATQDLTAAYQALGLAMQALPGLAPVGSVLFTASTIGPLQEGLQESIAASQQMDEIGAPSQLIGRRGRPIMTGIGMDEGTSQMFRLNEEVSQTEEALKELEALGDSKVQLTEEVEQRRLELMEQYADKRKQLMLAETQLQLRASSELFGSLGEMAQVFAGEQSDAYRAMFAASKAFAIAESVVKIQQGIANAVSLGWPAMIPAIASVVAASANIVSTIQSVRLEFAGAREQGGDVSKGMTYLVGEAGPELFVPKQDGFIVPNPSTDSTFNTRTFEGAKSWVSAVTQEPNNDLSQLSQVSARSLVDARGSDGSRKSAVDARAFGGDVTETHSNETSQRSARYDEYGFLLHTYTDARRFGGEVEKGVVYLVGEEGPELFVPTQSGMSLPGSMERQNALQVPGEYGYEPRQTTTPTQDNESSGRSDDIQVVLNNYSGETPEVSQRREGDRRIVEITLGHMRQELSAEIRDGRGAISRALKDTYGLGRTGRTGR